jgi:DnaJ homolog subfamily C member 2
MQRQQQIIFRHCRRYIERFNAKLREKAKKDEVKRLKAFVETAFNQDPRMVRRRQAEKAAR